MIPFLPMFCYQHMRRGPSRETFPGMFVSLGSAQILKMFLLVSLSSLVSRILAPIYGHTKYPRETGQLRGGVGRISERLNDGHSSKKERWSGRKETMLDPHLALFAATSMSHLADLWDLYPFFPDANLAPAHSVLISP